MIDGSFDQFGRPYVQGRLALPRLRVDNYIDFLVDTGADITTLHPRDAYLMRVTFNRLRPGTPIVGMGGVAASFEEPAVLVFQDGEFIRVYTTVIAIPEPGTHNMRLPTVLGQDILKKWRMVHDKSRDRLTFTPQGPQGSDLRMRGQIGDVHFGSTP